MRLKRALLALLLLLTLLWVPDCDQASPQAAEGTPFEWNQDAAWTRLEQRSAATRQSGCHSAGIAMRESIDALSNRVRTLPRNTVPGDTALDALEVAFFQTAADVAACPVHAPALLEVYATMRTKLKDLSLHWAMDGASARNRLYRLLYGSRMAAEEALLQMDPDTMPTLVHGRDEPSESPSTMVRGIRVHSGDVLVSRGGAPTSAFIARGNDYPGNFSHVALVHVSEGGTFRTIESHIEVGVVVAGLDTYEADEKLRVMLLRPRHDLAEGDFAHRAAEVALADAESRHIAYDFEMDYQDGESLFCSEVASQAYRSQDIALWSGLTSMSSPATARWLHRFGVRHFVTHGPSDLEYDPQLVVVAEWRNPETLFQDHVDAAAIDALLEGAEQGDEVHHSRGMLAFARLMKGWSRIKNVFGAEGPVPEGMSATVALRVQWMREQHGRIKHAVLLGAEAFRAERGYRPPYWELVRMANEARAAR